jgi:hypothetical protein
MFNLPQVVSLPIGFNISQTGLGRPPSNLQITLVYDTAVSIINRSDSWLDREYGR